MTCSQEEIEIEIDSELLSKLRFLAHQQGLTTEQHLSDLINRYIEAQTAAT